MALRAVAGGDCAAQGLPGAGGGRAARSDWGAGAVPARLREGGSVFNYFEKSFRILLILKIQIKNVGSGSLRDGDLRSTLIIISCITIFSSFNYCHLLPNKNYK